MKQYKEVNTAEHGTTYARSFDGFEIQTCVENNPHDNRGSFTVVVTMNRHRFSFRISPSYFDFLGYDYYVSLTVSTPSEHKAYDEACLAGHYLHGLSYHLSRCGVALYDGVDNVPNLVFDALSEYLGFIPDGSLAACVMLHDEDEQKMCEGLRACGYHVRQTS